MAVTRPPPLTHVQAARADAVIFALSKLWPSCFQVRQERRRPLMIGDALGLCLVRRHELRERDRQFVESLNEWPGEPTPKQVAWLRSIFERLVGGRRP